MGRGSGRLRSDSVRFGPALAPSRATFVPLRLAFSSRRLRSAAASVRGGSTLDPVRVASGSFSEPRGTEAEWNEHQSGPTRNRMETKANRSRTEWTSKGCGSEPTGRRKAPNQNRTEANGNRRRTEWEPHGPKQNRMKTNGARSRTDRKPTGAEAGPTQNRMGTKGGRSRTERDPKGTEKEPNGNQRGP